jgi:membrane protease subunit HflC
VKKTAVIVIAIAAAVGALLAVTFEVDETEFVVVTRFGDPRRVVRDAGLYACWPPPVDVVRRIDRRVHVLDPEPDEVLTSDKKNVLVNAFLTWAVEDPIRYLERVNDRAGAEARLTAILRSEVDTALGLYALDDLLNDEPSGETAASIADVESRILASTAREARESYGIEVTAVRIRRLGFPLDNKRAVFARMRAERERIAKGYRAEGKEEAEKIKAKAEREKAALLSEAGRTAEETRGAADAEAARIYARAYERDVRLYEFLRSLEALEKIVRENSTVVIPSDSKLLEVLSRPERFLAPRPAGEGAEK